MSSSVITPAAIETDVAVTFHPALDDRARRSGALKSDHCTGDPMPRSLRTSAVVPPQRAVQIPSADFIAAQNSHIWMRPSGCVCSTAKFLSLQFAGATPAGIGTLD